MQTVRQIAEAIVKREGGFVDDPGDPGGPTNHGVTLATLRRLGLDLNRDNRIDLRDLKSLGVAQAADIFVDHYYQAPGIARLPAVIRASVFDMYVNAGANAVKILQNLLNQMGISLVADGLIGPATAKAASQGFDMAKKYLSDAYAIARRNYYYALADRHPKLRKFARRKDGGKGGWIVRAESFMAEKYWLTEAEHRQRTAPWG